jgi:hypothetical protein
MASEIKVNLQALNTLNVLDRWEAAGDLVQAVNENPRLKRELPYPAEGYSHRFRGFHRLGKQTAKTNVSHFIPYVIRRGLKEETQNTIGMASIQLSATPPFETPSPSAEISYWHGHFPDYLAIGIGQTIVKQLCDARLAISAQIGEQVGQLWMVTLPDSEDEKVPDVKPEVLTGLDFHLEGDVQEYDLKDGVIEARQLWVRDFPVVSQY